MRLQDETVWLTQEQMAALFGKAHSTINEYIFAEGELLEGQVMQAVLKEAFTQDL